MSAIPGQMPLFEPPEPALAPADPEGPLAGDSVDGADTRSAGQEPLRDPRQMAFSVIGRGAAILLRSTFDGKRLTTALAVYGALTQLSSEARSPGEFRASRERVAEYAGVSDRTVDLYCREFERIRLLNVVRPRGGRHHPVNLWRLLQVAGDFRGEANRTPNDSGGEANRTPNGARGEANRTPDVKKKYIQEGKVLPFPRSPSRQQPDGRPDYNRALR